MLKRNVVVNQIGFIDGFSAVLDAANQIAALGIAKSLVCFPRGPILI